MKPIRGEVPAGFRLVEFGGPLTGQPQYEPLVAAVGPEAEVVSTWELDEDERAAIAAGGRLELTVLTFGSALQPVAVRIIEGGD